MMHSMTRGKQQILFNYLPGRTFDFDRAGTIAQIDSIRGVPNHELNLSLILDAIRRYASAWTNHSLAGIFHRPNPEQFILIEPKKVYSKLFPKVMWCNNRNCGRVFDFSNRDLPNSKSCPDCKTGHLNQLRFVKVHQCGEIKPLAPPYECKKCKSKNKFALNTRDSERIAGFVWICRNCGDTSKVFGGYCKSCEWQTLTGETDAKLRQMEVKVHRAGDTYFTHYEVLLNQPSSDISAFLNIENWQAIVAGLFLKLPELSGKAIKDFIKDYRESPQVQTSISKNEIQQLREMGRTDAEIDALEKMLSELQGIRNESEEIHSPSNISQIIATTSGVPEEIWGEAGQELLEAVLISQSDSTTNLLTMNNPNQQQQNARLLANELGISKLSLASDFPMTHASFGYSRVKYEPNECRLNAFPADKDHEGKFPIFVDLVQADAIIVQLDVQRVWQWFELNGISPNLSSNLGDTESARKAYFVRLLSPALLRQTLTRDNLEARMVFGLLHTMSHFFVRKAALLCGLDRTSLSEYILPRALTFAIYCNHRFGATIGALSSLFEQSLPEWLGQIKDESRRCIYDPVCSNKGGNCHACTHLAETSCRFFNLNLSRSFLFGGADVEINEIRYGYWNLPL